MGRPYRYIILLVLLCVVAFPSYGQADRTAALSFPGAEGYGRFTTGGRGGEVIKVTNLNDDGPGSLREAIEKTGPRIVVFDVSGTIPLASSLNIKNGDITIAGQSAPGDGICLKNYPLMVDADNVIIRFLRMRLGDEKNQETDAFGGRQQKRIMIDHCSVSWSVDEGASFYTNEDFTMQWCIVSESLNQSAHSKGRHGYGAIWGGNNTTFHHNLLAHHLSRNPRFSGSKYASDIPNRRLDYRNNVIYNWGNNSAYGNEEGEVNIINNYYKPGPATKENVKSRIVEPSAPFGKYYVAGNFVVGNEKVSENNWNGGVQEVEKAIVFHEEPFSSAPITSQTALEAYKLVMKYAGASLNRDAVDERIIREVKEGTATFKGSRTNLPGIIDSQTDVGGWPELESKPAPPDQDNDGMPDTWEKENGLNPSDPTDANGRKLNKDCDNIEVYLNSLVQEIERGQAGKPHFIVAKNGTGDFTTVQEAINAVPHFRANETVIFIKNGIYKEKLILPTSKTNVTFIGESVEKTILTNDDFASRKNVFGENMGTTGSTSFYIFGDNFTAQNITFENSAGPVGQAVAVRIDGDKVIFENCRFLGFQDTLYPHGEDSRQYYKNCYIEGTTDFIFGWSTAVFEDCTIHSKTGGSYVTAASTTEGTDYGFVFIDCKFTGDEGLQGVYLGRPWRPYAQTVLINSNLGSHINPVGWHNWNKPDAEKTSFYAEYNSIGPGAGKYSRVKWSHQLSEEQLEEYTIEKIFDGWIPSIN